MKGYDNPNSVFVSLLTAASECMWMAKLSYLVFKRLTYDDDASLVVTMFT
jgi:hypothetical protein